MDFCRFNDILCISSHFILVTLNQHKNKNRQKKISPFLSLARGIWYDCVVFVENMVIVRSPLNRNDFLCFYSQTVCFFCWFCVFVAEIKPKIIQNQSERSIKAKINRWWTKIKHQTKQIFYVKTEENVNHWFVMANKLNVFFFSLRLFVFRWLTFFFSLSSGGSVCGLNLCAVDLCRSQIYKLWSLAEKSVCLHEFQNELAILEAWNELLNIFELPFQI